MKTKHILSILLIYVLAFTSVPTLAGSMKTADELFAMYPVPEVSLAIDPAIDPLIRLVNRVNVLPSSHKPIVVTPVVKAKRNADVDLGREAANALEAMFSAAKAAGIELVAVSGYRSYYTQRTLYARSVERNGKKQADKVSAQAGMSEHQLGLAIDLSCASLKNELSSAFARKKEGKWVLNHCAEYGFIIRYKAEMTDITGYQGEPWHIRYVGQEHAMFIEKMKVPFETYTEYLQLVWENVKEIKRN